MFLAYLEALQSGDDVLVEFVLRSADPNLQAAIDYWHADDEIDRPTDIGFNDNPYEVEAFDAAEDLQEEHEEQLELMTIAHDKGDAYDLAGVLLAVALFIGGIGTLFRRRVLSWWLLGLGAVALIGGTTVAVTA